MSEKLVEQIHQILLLIFNEKSQSNKIIKETSSNRKRVKNKDGLININKIIDGTRLDRKKIYYELLPLLKKCDLITITKDNKIHEQMKFVDLSNFGAGFLSFFEDINKFDNSFDNYTKAFYERFERYKEKLDERDRQDDAIAYMNKKVKENLKKYETPFLKSLKEKYTNPNDEFLEKNDNEYEDVDINKYPDNFASFKRQLLSDAGFKDDEIEKFYDWIVMNPGFKKLILDLAIDFIIYRYNICLYEFKPNEKAKDLLEKFVKDKLAFYMNKKIDLIIDKSQITIDKDDDNDVIKEINLRNFKYEFFDMCDSNLEEIIIYIYYHLSNRFIKNDLKRLVKCLTSIVGLEKEYCDYKIKECDMDMKSSWMTERDKERSNHKKLLFEIYRDRILTDA